MFRLFVNCNGPLNEIVTHDQLAPEVYGAIYSMLYYIQNKELHLLSAAVRIRGPDAYTYLQGQFTQDLNRPPGTVFYGLWLNEKGKVIADSHVLRLGENDFQIISPALSGSALRERLEACLVADEVSVEDESDSWALVSLWGEGAALAMTGLSGPAPLPGNWTESRGLRTFAGRRSPTESREFLFPPSAEAEVCAALAVSGAQQVDAATAERERILGAQPAVPVDIGPRDLPNEGGLEKVAISYTKGCYLGQEVMARLKNLGQFRRRLHVVRGPGEPPVSGEALYQTGRKVGEFRSSASDGTGFVAMAMLSLVAMQPGEGLARTPESEPSIRILRRV